MRRSYRMTNSSQMKPVVQPLDRTPPPFRDRSVKVRSVPCPVCKVGVDEYCVTDRSHKKHDVHRPRRRLAIRKEAEDAGS